MTTKGRYYWRLNIGLEKAGKDPGIWKLTVSVNLGYRPYSESSRTKTKWLGDASSYAGSEVLTTGTPAYSEKLIRGVAREGARNNSVLTMPDESSSLAAVARMALEKCQLKLCGKVLD